MTQQIENIIKLILMMMIPAVAIAFIVGAIKIFKSFKRKACEDNLSECIHKVIVFVLCLMAVGLWLMYFDIYKVVLTAIGVPFVHMILFMIVGFVSAYYVKDSKLLLVLSILSYITFLLFYIIMPGGVEMYEGRCAIFGMITDEKVLDECINISMRAMQINVIFMIAQVVMVIVSRKKAVRIEEEMLLDTNAEVSEDAEETENTEENN